MPPRAPRSSRKVGIGNVDAQASVLSARSGVVPEWIDRLTQSRIDQLRLIALVAESIVAQGVSDELFSYLVKFVADARFVISERLAEMGRVDRSTASRWIHGTSAPPILMQETILGKIAKEVEMLAEELDSANQIGGDETKEERGVTAPEPRAERAGGGRGKRD